MEELISELNKDRVTIYILKYKSPDIERECINRLLDHTGGRYTISIVDTIGIDPNFSKIWNQLIRECPTDLLVIMDSDVYVQDDWLTKLKEGIGIDKCAAVYPGTDNSGSPCQKRLRGMGCVEVPDCVPILALFKKDIFNEDKVGMFDEEFHVYGQDTEWGQRARFKGYKLIMQTNCVVQHICHGSTDKAHKDGEINNYEESQLSNRLWLKKRDELIEKYGELPEIVI